MRRAVPALLVALGACVPGPGTPFDEVPPPEGLVALADVDEPPRELACPFDDPQRVPPPELRVSLSFVVSERGEVVPGTVRIRPSHHSEADTWRQERAMEMVLSCRYEPARIKDRPVAVRYHETFYMRP